MNRQKNIPELTLIGWREWIEFPEWGIKYLKAKVDTGARTSSLHAEEMSFFDREGVKMVRFTVFPWQNSNNDPAFVESEIISFRKIRSSSGCLEKRPVILSNLKVSGIIIRAELTLTNRDQMGFRMLLGREAIRKNFMVAAGRSYLGGKPAKAVTLKNRGRSQ